MLYKLWNDFITSYKLLTGTGAILVLFVVSFIFAVCVKDKEERGRAVFYVLSVYATICHALTGAVKRVFNLEYSSKTEKIIARIMSVILAVCIATISGNRIISRNYYEKADNSMHIPQGFVNAMDVVLEDAPKGAGVITMPGYSEYLGAYSSKLTAGYEDPMYGDLSTFKEEDRLCYEELSDNHPDMTKVVRAARSNGCDYIILNMDSYWPKRPLEEIGFKVLDDSGDFTVYKAERSVVKK